MRISTLSAAAVILIVPGPAVALWPFSSTQGTASEQRRSLVIARDGAAPATGNGMAKREWYCYWFGENCPVDSTTTPAVTTNEETKPEEWTQIDMAVAQPATTTPNPWKGFTQFDWTPWTGWSFWGYTLNYVEGWYYDNYGLHLAPGVPDWAHLSSIVSYYGTPPSKQTATPSINVFTHGGSLPFGPATAHVATTTSAHSTSTPSPTVTHTTLPAGNGKTTSTTRPAADAAAFADLPAGQAGPQMSSKADYTSLVTHAASASAPPMFSRKPSKEEVAFYAMSAAAAAAKGTGTPKAAVMIAESTPSPKPWNGMDEIIRLAALDQAQKAKRGRERY